jgi:uncharacterized protein (DUF305 family)
MRTRIALISVAIVSLFAATASVAQNPHAGHGAHSAGAGQPQTMGDMDRMMGMMRQMMSIMERMRNATPAERERMMNEMRPMMQGMMPMMQGMMGGPGMGAMTGPGHQGHGPTSTSASPSTRAFEEANAKMHRDMAIAFTGNADVDFVRGMIPHHQGAIDMARVVLQHGRNDQTRKWANEIIAAQEREIAEMREWLARNSP